MLEGNLEEEFLNTDKQRERDELLNLELFVVTNHAISSLRSFPFLYRLLT